MLDVFAGQHARQDSVEGVDGDGEGDAGVGADRAFDSGGDAKQRAVGVDEDAAGVARVEGGVGLDHAELRASAGVGAGQRAAETGDDAGAKRVLEAVGCADGGDEVADLDGGEVGAVEQDDGDVGGVDSNHGEVVGRVAADEGGFGGFAGEGADLDPVGVFDDMVVGDDVAAVVDEEA